MLEYKEALKIILEAFYPENFEIVSIPKAANRVLFEEIHSDMDLPPYDCSVMDGYAILYDKNSTEYLSVSTIAAGDADVPKITGNCACKIMTGAKIPAGADTVIKKEDVEVNYNKILLKSSPTKGSNIKRKGAEISKGTKLSGSNIRLNPYHLGLLSSAKKASLKVYKIPSVLILSTGNELCMLDNLKGTKLVASNGYTLKALLEKNFVLAEFSEVLEDDPDLIKKKISENIYRFDLIISTGGSSGGEFDFMTKAFLETGGELKVENVNIKPGKTFKYGQLEGKPFFILPGTPVAMATTFEVFIKPLILKLSGISTLQPSELSGTIEGSFSNNSNRTSFEPAKYFFKEGKIFITFPVNEAGYIANSFISANCIAILPPNSRFASGDIVEIIPLN